MTLLLRVQYFYRLIRLSVVRPALPFEPFCLLQLFPALTWLVQYAVFETLKADVGKAVTKENTEVKRLLQALTVLFDDLFVGFDPCDTLLP